MFAVVMCVVVVMTVCQVFKSDEHRSLAEMHVLIFLHTPFSGQI